MGTTTRGAAAESRYIRAWLLLVVLLPVAVSAAVAVWMLLMAERLPTELASHWNAHNEVDGYSSLGALMAMTVATASGAGSVIGALAVLMRDQGALVARLGVGVGVAAGLALSALFAALAAGQLDLADAAAARLAQPVLVPGLGVALLAGVLAGWLFRPTPQPRTAAPSVTAMAAAVARTESAVARTGREQAARRRSLSIKVSMGPWVWPLSLAVSLAAGLALAGVTPWLAPLGLLAGAVLWTFAQGTLSITPAGVRVLAGGFLPLLPARWSEVSDATVEQVRALDYGGWGYRLTGTSTAFILRSGPALCLHTTFRQRLVISLPSAAVAGEAAALAAAYAAAAKVPS